MEDLTKTAFISFSKIIIFKMEFFQTEFSVFFENQVSWTMGFSFQLAHFPVSTGSDIYYNQIILYH